MSSRKLGNFQPIAIVGRGCVLPGCFSVDDLWRVVEQGRVETSSASEDDWHVNQNRLLSDETTYQLDKMWSNDGGYVRDFENHFDASQFKLDPELLEKLDPVFLWSMEAARQATTSLASSPDPDTAGVVLGNLSYPTRAHSRFAEEVWLSHMRGNGEINVAPENRFMSGLPAMLVAQSMGLTGNTMALDAACASGLYAIKIACDRLQNGEADFMLAGGVNAADPLFIHMGFCALNALSKTGTSQPFSQNADGLVPSDGAAFVGLKRLADARADGDEIYGVIRGIGLSNDGRSGGFLSPSTDGQVASLQRAYQVAGVDPSEIQFIECHATGTEAGDSTEINSLSTVFPDAEDLPLGSLKGNLGHLITASGVAGLLKIILAFEHKTIPGTPNATPNLKLIKDSGFSIPEGNSEWVSDGARTAAISSFGFGGNNAHLIVQEDNDAIPQEEGVEKRTEMFAIVSLAVKTDLDATADAFGRRLCGTGAIDDEYDNSQVALAAKSLAFPPNDLKESLGQQLILLDLLTQVESSLEKTEKSRTGIFIGMQTDNEVCRYGLRWRLMDLDAAGAEVDFDTEIASSPNASSVIGKMPNVPANRLSNQLDITGPGFTVSREELSGDASMELAMTAISRGELDAAIVGAVELGDEQVQAVALSSIAAKRSIPEPTSEVSDGAVLLVIKSAQQAEADGDHVLAFIEAGESGDGIESNAGLTDTHVASGLLNLAAGVQRLRAGLSSMSDTNDAVQHNDMQIINTSVFGESSSWRLRPAIDGEKAFAATDRPEMELYAAIDRESLVSNIRGGITCNDSDDKGFCRVALVGRSSDLEKLRSRAIEHISSNTDLKSWSLNGISFSEEPIQGEVASVFTGAASAYPGMGQDLFLGFPAIGREVAAEMPESARAMSVASNPSDDRHQLPAIQLAGSSYLSQLHARISRDLLKLKPTVAFGLSSGETNSMFAFDVWQDMDSLRRDIDQTELYRSALAKDFTAVRAAWNLDENEAVDWQNYSVVAPVDEVKRAVEDEDFVYLTIIQTDRDSVIGGERSACEAVLKRLGNPDYIPLGHDLAVHCAAVEPFESTWRKVHTRTTKAPRGIRFYSNFLDGEYKVSKKSVADALTGQALQTVDFRKIVEKTWNDGVRIFVEHGPRNSLTSAIDEILGGRPHLAVSLDHSAVPSMSQLYRSAAMLWCAGVNIDLDGLRLSDAQSADEPVQTGAPTIPFRLRLPPIKVQAVMSQVTDEKFKSCSVYDPPVLTAGPSDGQLIPRAPSLAFCINPPEGTAEEVEAPVQLKVESVKPPISEPQPIERIAETNTAVSSDTVTVSGEHQLLVESHKRMVDAHQAFLATQMEGQRAFEETMGKMQAALLGGAVSENSVVQPDQSINSPTTLSVVEPSTDKAAPENRRSDRQTQSQTQTQTQKETPLKPIKKPVEAVASPKMASPKMASPKTPVQKTTSSPSINRPGPSFSREQLIVLAGGKISSVFGSLFEKQDEYDVQVRMPEPPLLLCDRVMGIEGEAGSMGTGTVWTETDVLKDSWYLHRGRMPPGIFIESGQADLLLISWLGIDFHNKGDRAYRLLGCELVFHGELPQPGDTLKYEIKVDGHAKQGDVRLFFFHYDCHINGELRISVRSGQAGFFTKKELSESAGVLWDAADADFTDNIKVPDPIALCTKSSFSRTKVAAYLKGDLQTCFGGEFAYAHTHTRTPGSPEGQGNFLGEVTHFDPAGGPAGRGYLRVVEDIHSDDWFFDGHFKNDPCMPGTLMADACLQAMAFYMSARGCTLFHDGWRFQPIRATNYKFICRGQALPESGQLVYEIFVDEEIIDDQPKLYATVLCTIDGRKAFLCERLGLQLVPDWPLSSMPELLEITEDHRPLAYIDDFPLDYRSLISCAWGKPSNAFGEGFSHYDGPLRSPRLPGPPYHFMTRIVALEGEMASMKKGGRVEAIYDIPADAWFFDDNSSRTMPYCVLMEIALQPCGWLASYTLGRDYAESDLLFRNLDGTAVQHREILPDDGTLKTTSILTSISQVGELIIENFDVICTIDDKEVFTMKTVFGFFPPDAMANQKGLKISDYEQSIFDRSSNINIDFTDRPAVYFGQAGTHLPDSKLLMLDRITYLAVDGGEAGLGSIRAEKDVDITEWFFKSHFYQDPVQPGSLGIEAMLQLIEAMMIARGMHEEFVNPRFEPIAISDETEWHYRGQITPDKSMVTIDFECTECSNDKNDCRMVGEARLWGDELKIYHAPRIGVRIVEDQQGLANGIDANDKGESVDWHQIRDYWIRESGGEHFLIHDLGSALMRQFVNRLVLSDPDEFRALKGQPAIYLANHQVGVESFLFLGMIAALIEIPAEAIAKKEHRDTWLGQISQLTDIELKENSTTRMLFFDRDGQSDMLRILSNFGESVHEQPRSLLVHVDGTRATRAAVPTLKVSSVLIDLAINHKIPIVPVRFTGGLPIEESSERLEFPVGYGGQDYHIGSVITAAELESLPYAERAKRVVTAINDLGQAGLADKPGVADEKFSDMLASLPDQTEIQAVLRTALECMPELGDRMKELIENISNKDETELSPAETIVAKLLG